MPFFQAFVLLFILVVTSATCSASDQRPLGSVQSHSREIAKSDWTAIRTAYEAGQYAVQTADDGHIAQNSGQQWRTHFDGRAFLTTPQGGGWQWGLELLSYGATGDENVIAGKATVQAAGTRLTYGWDARVEEWFVNDRRGLEHGFTVKQRPSGVESVLTFKLGVRGGLKPHVAADGQGVAFVKTEGNAAVTYTGLKVWDADGRSLPSNFEASTSSDLLTLRVDERGARYPLTVDPIAQQAYLKASNAGAGDVFGWSVAVSGDTAVVGALLQDGGGSGVNPPSDKNGPDTGSAYVFVRSGGVWTQQAYLKASNPGAGDYFGHSVAISGNTIVVGAPREAGSGTGVNPGDSNNAQSSGAAYVFFRNGTSWTQQAYLKASNSGEGDEFGCSVGVSGDTVVVGAFSEGGSGKGINPPTNENASGSGAAYVFTRSSATWSQQAYIKASNSESYDQFGWSVAVDADTIAVGARLEDGSGTGVNPSSNEGASGSGAVYVFARSGSTWSQQAYLKASNTGGGDQFGGSVAVAGNTVVVGADQEDGSGIGVNPVSNESADIAGAAYVFMRSGSVWSPQAYLKASNTQHHDQFGYSVGISGDTVVVGAFNEDGLGTGINPPSNESGVNVGAAYVFIRGTGTWTQQAYLKASNPGSVDQFGYAVAVSGDTVVVGANYEDGSRTGVNAVDDNEADGAGAAYLFSGLGPVTVAPGNTAPVITSNAGGTTASISVAENTTAVTTVIATDAEVPATQTLTYSKTGADAGLFSLNTTTGVLTFITAPDFETPTDAGANNVYEVTVTATDSFSSAASDSQFLTITVTNVYEAALAIAQQAYIKASDNGAFDQAGYSVAISGETVVVGVHWEDSSTTGIGTIPNNSATDAGAVLVFVRNGGTWTQQAYLKASNTGADDQFGTSVAISGDTLIVGAVQEDSSSPGVGGTPNEGASNSGAAYVFTRSGTSWTQQAYLKASNPGANDRFGNAVAIDGNTAIIGAVDEDGSSTGVNGVANDNASNAGAAYVFTRTGTTWSQQAYVKPSNTDADDYFGWSVAISGDSMVVGAAREDSSTSGINSTPYRSANGAGAAYVFVRSGVSWTQQAYLKPSNTGEADEFGSSVAFSGDTIVVGARYEDSGTRGVNSEFDEVVRDAGAAYVFVRSSGVWSQQAYLKSSNPGVTHHFGSSCAVHGNVVVVGSYGETSSISGVNSVPNTTAPNAGAAYVFKRNGNTWSRHSYLKSTNAAEYHAFGHAVSISGDIIAIGAPDENSGSTGINSTPTKYGGGGSGALYIFTLSSAAPGPDIAIEQPAGTDIPNAGLKDLGTVGVGSTRDFVFTVKNTGTASLALNGSPKVTVGGGDAAMFTVTAQPTSSVSAGGSTSFTVRFAPNSVGAKAATLSIPNDDVDEKPFVIALTGTAVVTSPEIAVEQSQNELSDGGALSYDAVLVNTGVTKTFTINNTGTGNLSVGAITKTGGNATNFTISTTGMASSVIPGGSTSFTVTFKAITLGPFSTTLRIANNDTDENPFDIALSAESQSIEQLTAPQSVRGSETIGEYNFGYALAISGNTMVVGAQDELGMGVAYVFVRSGGSWVQQAYLKPFADGSGNLVSSVAVSGDTLVIGFGSADFFEANGVDRVGQAGRAYVFVRSGTTWTEQALLQAANIQTGAGFGYSVSISGNTIAVGASGESGSGVGVNPSPNSNALSSGAAYIFVRSGDSWSQQAYLKAPNTETQDWFGQAVAISGDSVIIGAPGEGGGGYGVNPVFDNNDRDRGAAYIYKRTNNLWAFDTYLKSDLAQGGDYYGSAVALDGDTAVVGHDNDNTDGADGFIWKSGAAYIYKRSGSTWSQQAYLKASNAGERDDFGVLVAISGDTVVIAATRESGGGVGVNPSSNEDADNAGAVYVFQRNGNSWSQMAYVKSLSTSEYQHFGNALAISAGTIVAGTMEAPAGEIVQAPIVYIYPGFGTANPTTPGNIPQFTGGLPPAGTLGQGYSYTPTFSESPTRYAADGLPQGLTINANTGEIFGTPSGTFAAGVTAYHYLIGLYATNSAGTGWSPVNLTIRQTDSEEPQGGLAPAKLSAGTEFSYEGSVDDTLLGDYSDSQTIKITSATAFEGGTYTYTKTGPNTAKLTYRVSTTMADYSEVETGEILVTFTTTNSGTYSSKGAYKGNDEGEPFNGSFTGSGQFTITGLVMLPVANTLAATEVTATGAKLNATVNAKGSNREVIFEYGTTTAYGSTANASVSISGDALVSASRVIGDLLPHTTYHFRVKAEGEFGAAIGQSKTFTTATRVPVAQADSAYVLPAATVTIPVLDNDADPDEDTLSILSFTQPAATVGKVAKVGANLVFTASPKFSGGSFTYIAADAFNGKSTATQVTLALGPCSISPASVFIAAAQSSHSVTVTTDGDWSALETLPWITVTPLSGSGNGEVSVTVQANTTKISRTGMVIIGGQAHSIVQAGTSGFTIDPPSVVPEGLVAADYTLQITGVMSSVSFTANNLPTGLSINKTSGVISGKPKASGTFSVNVIGSITGGISTTIIVPITIHPLPVGAVGTFQGPVARNVDLADNDNLGGRFELTTTLTGSFSGKITLGAKTYPFPSKGQLNTNLDSEFTEVAFSITRKAPLPALQVSFTIDSANNAIVDGDVHDGAHHSEFHAWRNVWLTPGLDSSTRADLNRYLGLHTFALQPPLAEPDLPQGSGFGSFTVAAKTGVLTAAGKVADGTAFTCGTFAGPHGEVLVFQPLYSNRGSLLGNLNVTVGTEDYTPPYGDNILDGTISWSRPAVVGRIYTDGFGPFNLTAVGGRYIPPVAPALVLGITDTLTNNATLAFDGAEIINTLPDISFRLKAKSAFVAPPENPRKTSFTVTPSNGSFTGSFTLSDPNAIVGTAIRAATFYGQILRDDDNVLRGYGFFLLPDSPQTTGETVKNTPQTSGRVVLEKNQ